MQRKIQRDFDINVGPTKFARETEAEGIDMVSVRSLKIMWLVEDEIRDQKTSDLNPLLHGYLVYIYL